MVIGHKNPDTDSICSAIAYAQFKRDVAGVAAVPYRAGNLNPQTSFVLEHFGVVTSSGTATPKCSSTKLVCGFKFPAR